MNKIKLKISELLELSDAFGFAFNQGVLFTKEPDYLDDFDMQEQFTRILDSFPRKEEMFEQLFDAKKYLGSLGPPVGFLIVEKDDASIHVTRLHQIFDITICTINMGSVNYQKFFDEFFDLEGRRLVVNDLEE